MLTTKPSAINGQTSRISASWNAMKSPLLKSGSLMSRVPPYQNTMSTPNALTVPMTGPMDPRSLARLRLASRYLSLARSKAASSEPSIAKERTTRTPARLASTRSLISPIASWLAFVRV